jgi:hypothetical protein
VSRVELIFFLKEFNDLIEKGLIIFGVLIQLRDKEVEYFF